MTHSIRIQNEDFDIGAEWAAMQQHLAGRAGAMAAFCGIVRDQFDAARIEDLELEHYPGMTERSIESVLARADARWTLDASLVIHRIGRLLPSDQIVLVMTAARHRHSALEACTFIIDSLKTEAVFWKRERTSAGERWIDSTTLDHARTEQWRKDA